MQAAISGAKAELIGPEELEDKSAGASTSAASPTCTVEYQSRLSDSFCHGLRRPAPSSTVRLLRRFPEVLAELPDSGFKHVLVDEYQDTNRAENEIVLPLARSTTT